VDYYSYLISVFIDHNLGNQNAGPWYIITTPTGTINVHTLGVSLLLLPFFAIGYIFASFTGAELNGVSAPFMVMVSLGALCYLTLGLHQLKKLLIGFGIKDKWMAITLLLLFFGTNLLNYALYEPSMSHVYSFALISTFLYSFKKFSEGFSRKYLYVCALVLGLIILVRPVNALIVLTTPFLAGSFVNFKKVIIEIFQNKKYLIVSASFFLGTLFIQSVTWYAQNGYFLQWSYKSDGFYFDTPHIWSILLGFSSGLFIYTPLCLVALFGFIPLYKQNKFRAVVLLLFLAFSYYFFSCFWAYTYFEGLGIRTFVDYYALYALLLAMFLTYVESKKIKFAALGTAILSSAMGLIFSYQYQAEILPRAGMNFVKFKYIFLNTGDSYRCVLGGCMDMEPYYETVPEKIYSYNQDEVYTYDSNEFGLAYKIDSLKLRSNKLYVKVDLNRKENDLNSSQKALLVVHVQAKNGDSKNYQAYRLNDVPASHCCDWEKLNYKVSIPDKVEPGDKLSVYIWNKEKQQFLIDKFSVEIYNYNYKTS
jgi:hypothetical protein